MEITSDKSPVMSTFVKMSLTFILNICFNICKGRHRKIYGILILLVPFFLSCKGGVPAKRLNPFNRETNVNPEDNKNPDEHSNSNRQSGSVDNDAPPNLVPVAIEYDPSHESFSSIQELQLQETTIISFLPLESADILLVVPHNLELLNYQRLANALVDITNRFNEMGVDWRIALIPGNNPRNEGENNGELYPVWKIEKRPGYIRSHVPLSSDDLREKPPQAEPPQEQGFVLSESLLGEKNLDLRENLVDIFSEIGCEFDLGTAISSIFVKRCFSRPLFSLQETLKRSHLISENHDFFRRNADLFILIMTDRKEEQITSHEPISGENVFSEISLLRERTGSEHKLIAPFGIIIRERYNTCYAEQNESDDNRDYAEHVSQFLGPFDHNRDLEVSLCSHDYYREGLLHIPSFYFSDPTQPKIIVKDILLKHEPIIHDPENPNQSFNVVVRGAHASDLGLKYSFVKRESSSYIRLKYNRLTEENYPAFESDNSHQGYQIQINHITLKPSLITTTESSP